MPSMRFSGVAPYDGWSYSWFAKAKPAAFHLISRDANARVLMRISIRWWSWKTFEKVWWYDFHIFLFCFFCFFSWVIVLCYFLDFTILLFDISYVIYGVFPLFSSKALSVSFVVAHLFSWPLVLCAELFLIKSTLKQFKFKFKILRRNEIWNWSNLMLLKSTCIIFAKMY